MSSLEDENSNFKQIKKQQFAILLSNTMKKILLEVKVVKYIRSRPPCVRWESYS